MGHYIEKRTLADKRDIYIRILGRLTKKMGPTTMFWDILLSYFDSLIK